MESVVVKSIKKIEEKTGEKIEYDPVELKQGLSTGIAEALPAVTESMDVVKEENGAELDAALKILDLFSVKYLIILICVLVILAAIIYVVAGLLGNTAISLVIDFLKNDYESLIAPVTVLVGTIFKQFLTNGIFTLIPGIALCVVGFVFKAKKSE